MKEIIKDKFFILLITVITLSIILVFVLAVNTQDNSSDNLNQQSEIKNHGEIKDLLASDNYIKIDENNSKIKHILSAIDDIAYEKNISNYDALSYKDITRAVSSFIKDEDIYNVTEDNGVKFGYISKETINDYFYNTFKNEKELALIEEESLQLKNASKEYYNAVVMESKKDSYYFKFYPKEETSLPSPKIINRKIMSIKSFEKVVLIEEKVIYYDFEEDSKTVYSDRERTIIIDELNFDETDSQQVENTTIDVNNYLDKAGTIYIVLNKKDGNFYFKMSQLYNK